jgi:genome maintenance exonuclease 1|tara:strand:- start:388 stop:1104 length:717 start_codon:yes stop_codon:yes gene_type:complete
MKKFNHTPVKLEKIKATTNNGNRLYETPSGDLYPSITTVLSPRNKKGLMEWRKRVGEDVANHVARTAAARGTKVHHMCEDYLNNMSIDDPEKWAQHKKNFLPYCLFEQLKNQTFNNIGDIYAQEAGLYSDKYKVAGRVDCIAKYKGDISIIDFKTSTKERSDDWNENYYIQGSAYAEMFEELTGIVTNQVVILVVTEDGTVQEFVKQKSNYTGLLVDAISDWREQNVIRENIVTVVNN